MRWRILPLLFLLHFWAIGIGQTEKGSWLVNGKATTNSYGNLPTFDINIQPEIGYFFIDNLIGGVKTGFFYRQSKIKTTLKYTNYFATPFLHYYFLKGKFRPFVQADFAFDWYRRPTRIMEIVNGSTNFVLTGYKTEFQTASSISIGANYFLSKNVALNAQFIYFLHDDRKDINRSQNVRFKGFRFGLNYFFNPKNQFSKDTLAPLVTRYLKKGNYSIGLNGQVHFRNFKQGLSEGTVEWSIFLMDKLRLNNKLISVAFWGDDTFDYLTYWGYQPNIQVYFPVSPSVFLTTSLGGDVGLFHIKVPWRTDTNARGWSLLGKSSLIHFRRNSILEFGAEFRYFFRDRFMIESKRWDSDLFLKFRQFLTANLSVQLEARTNLFGLSRREVFGNQNVDAPDFLRFGFSYFIEKKN